MVKCRIQTNPAKYKSIVTGFKVFQLFFKHLKNSWWVMSFQVSVAEEGMRGLVRGWAPTAIGYSAQVIWFYRWGWISSFQSFGILGSLQVWILWSLQDRLCQCFGRGECVRLQNWSVLGSICLCWVLRWYCIEPNGSLQSANSNYAWLPCYTESWCTSYLPVGNNLNSYFSRDDYNFFFLYFRQEGLNGFYKSLVPLWMRQIPYTMMKFACFEKTVELLYK